MSLQVFVLLAATMAGVMAQSGTVQINTPMGVQACLPTQISWTGGTGPYYVTVVPGGQASGPILKDFGQQNSSSLTWEVDQPAGTALTLQVRDSNGQMNFSDQFHVQPSTKTCATSSSSSSSSATPATPATPATTGTASSNKNGTSASTTTSSTNTTKSSTTSPTTSTTSSTTSSTPASTGAQSGDASRVAGYSSGLCALALSVVVAVCA